MLVILRSAVFNVLFYLNLLVHFVVAIPTLVMPRMAIVKAGDVLGPHQQLAAARRVRHQGRISRPRENSRRARCWSPPSINRCGRPSRCCGCSADPAFILKRELQWIPFFGWYATKAGMIPVDRGRRGQALADMTERARVELARGRQIVIFPEGTRRAPGAEPSYKFGIAHLYGETGMPCLPIALNSGLFWPRRSFLRYPGTIVAEVLDPIPPGLSKDAFAARLQQDIETATARLIAEGERELAKNGIRSAPAARTSG